MLDPILATSRGVVGHDAEMTDYSPDGQAARAEIGDGRLGAVSVQVECDDGSATDQIALQNIDHIRY